VLYVHNVEIKQMLMILLQVSDLLIGH